MSISNAACLSLILGRVPRWGRSGVSRRSAPWCTRPVYLGLLHNRHNDQSLIIYKSAASTRLSQAESLSHKKLATSYN